MALLLRAKPRAAAPDGDHWITIGGHEEGDEKHKGGSPVLIDAQGRIKGGSVPKFFQGMSLKEMSDDRHIQREWKGNQKALRYYEDELARMDAQIPALAQHLKREADAGRRLMLAQIREVTEGQMITPDDSEENRAVPGYYKRDPRNSKKVAERRARSGLRAKEASGAWTMDAVADALGMTENELRRQLIELEDRRHSFSNEHFLNEAEDLVHGDDRYIQAKEALASLKEGIGSYKGPRKVSEAAERTRKWRDRLKAEGRTENKPQRKRDAASPMARSARLVLGGEYARDPNGRFARRGSRGHWNGHVAIYRRRRGKRGDRRRWLDHVRDWRGRRGRDALPDTMGSGPRMDPNVGAVGAMLSRSMTEEEKARPSYRRRLAVMKRRRAWAKREPLTSKERGEVRRRFGRYLASGCAWVKFGGGFVFYTHRCRSKIYPSIDSIPVSRVRFVASTG